MNEHLAAIIRLLAKAAVDDLTREAEAKTDRPAEKDADEAEPTETPAAHD